MTWCYMCGRSRGLRYFWVMENIHRRASWNDLTQQERTRFFGGHNITQWKRSHFAIDFFFQSFAQVLRNPVTETRLAVPTRQISQPV